MALCPGEQGPVITSELIGVGIRVSAYLQAFTLPILCARSTLVDEISSALYSVITFTFALSITAFSLAFKQDPTISLQDALVTTALLGILWTSILLSFGSYNRYVHRDKVPEALFVLLTFLVSAFGITVLASARTIGSSPECNTKAVVVLLRPISVLDKDKGRILGLVAMSTVLVAYAMILVLDYKIFERFRNEALWKRNKEAREDDVAENRPTYPDAEFNYEFTSRRKLEAANNGNVGRSRGQTNIFLFRMSRIIENLNLSGPEVVVFVVVVTTVPLFAMNTELMVRWNKFQANSSSWQLGQILPLVLLVPMISRMIQNLTPSTFVTRSERKIQRHRSQKTGEKRRRGESRWSSDSSTIVE